MESPTRAEEADEAAKTEEAGVDNDELDEEVDDNVDDIDDIE